MKKTILIGAVMTLMLVFTLTIVGTTYSNSLADENGNKPTIEEREEKRAGMEAKRAEMMEVISSGDYDAWAELMSEAPHGEKILELINESNWDQFVEAHKLMEEGRAKMEEARGIMDGLGLEKPKLKGRHWHGPKPE